MRFVKLNQIRSLVSNHRNPGMRERLGEVHPVPVQLRFKLSVELRNQELLIRDADGHAHSESRMF